MHWSDRVLRILASNSGDLKVLAKLAGIDSPDLYKYQSLAGCDLRGQDLRGFDLEGCQLEDAIIDSATKLDKNFDPRSPDHISDYISFSISRGLNTMLLHYMEEVGYSYAAWAHKKIFERGLAQFQLNRQEKYRGIIQSNKHLTDVLKIGGGGGVLVRVLLYRRGKRDMENALTEWPNEGKLREVMLIGLLSRKIRNNDRRDYSQISLNALYPPKAIRVEGKV